MRNQNNIAKNIMELLRHFPEIKNDKNSIIGHYWVMFDDVSALSDYSKATPAESITRIYRNLVSNGYIAIERPEPEEIKFNSEFSDIG
jgi:hypothetical protein